jgi:hypothetical protein
VSGQCDAHHASVFITDDERTARRLAGAAGLEWLAPYDASPERYHHNRTGEDNGDAHHKRGDGPQVVPPSLPAARFRLGADFLLGELMPRLARPREGDR